MSYLPDYQYFYPDKFYSNCVPSNHYYNEKKIIECNMSFDIFSFINNKIINIINIFILTYKD